MKQRVKEFLENNRGTFTYGDVAKQLGTIGRAVGACMRALGKDGFAECGRVIKK